MAGLTRAEKLELARRRDRLDVEERSAAVLAALERHGGDTKAAGAELGLRGNIVAIIAKHARARAAATPAVATPAEASS